MIKKTDNQSPHNTNIERRHHITIVPMLDSTDIERVAALVFDFIIVYYSFYNFCIL